MNNIFKSPEAWADSIVNKRIEKLWIASAFVTSRAFRNLKSSLNARNIQIITGDMNFFNTPSDLREILRINPDTSFFSQRVNFHAKVYAAQYGNDVNVLVGSSNLTGAGFTEFHGNLEVNLQSILSTKDWNKFWTDLLKRSNADKLTDSIITQYSNRLQSIPMPKHIFILNGVAPAGLYVYDKPEKEFLFNRSSPRCKIELTRTIPDLESKPRKAEIWLEMHRSCPTHNQLWFSIDKSGKNPEGFSVLKVIRKIKKNQVSEILSKNIDEWSKVSYKTWLANFEGHDPYLITYSYQINDLKKVFSNNIINKQVICSSEADLRSKIIERLGDRTIGYEREFQLREFLSDAEFSDFVSLILK